MVHIGAGVLQYEEEMIYHLQQLIRINSVASEPRPDGAILKGRGKRR